MKQITQKEFDDLPIVNGLRVCPKSDFSQIKFLGKVVIPDWSIIGDESDVGERSIIGNYVDIGHDVIIRTYAKIGNHVQIANYVKIGDFAEVGNHVKIGDLAEVGESVKFGTFPRFGWRTKFKAETAFEDKGIAKPGYPIRMFEGFGSQNRCICFYNLVSGIYVRAGCFLGTKEEFIDKTRSDGDAKKLAEYTMMVQMAELGFSN